jgi:hypothetical protein
MRLWQSVEYPLRLLSTTIPLIILMAAVPSAECLAGEETAAPRFPSLQLTALADTTRASDTGKDWSSDHIKDLLAQETGEIDIEESTWKTRKNPRTAMLCALAFPGLGQIYNEKAFKAVIAFGVETFYILNILHNYRKTGDYEKERDSYDQYVPCGPGGEDSCLNPYWRDANAWYEEYKERTIDWVWWTSAVILIVMLDAYVDAHLHDMRFRLETARRGGGTGLAVVVDF